VVIDTGFPAATFPLALEPARPGEHLKTLIEWA
jgi:hypothetical protein